MKIEKITMPLAIVLGSVIIALVYYVVETKVQNNILLEKQRKEEKEHQDTVFNNSIKCQAILKDDLKQYNNVKSIYYDEEKNACMETIITNGKEEVIQI